MPPASSVEARAAQRLLTGESWEDFCEVLKVAGRMIEIFGETPSDLDRAEWYRFITRLARSSIERLVENAEPTRPRLRDMPWRQSINVQCPDHDHLMCQFDEARDYRIVGTRGTLPYFVMAVLTAPAPADLAARDWAAEGVEGLKQFDPSNLKTTGFLGSQQINVAADGTFEVILSQKDPGPGKNWLKLQPDTNCILIRMVWHERGKETPPQMRIERIDGAAPEPISPALMANNLAWAAQGVLGYAELVRNWWQGTQGNFAARPNRLTFSRAQYLSNGGVPDRHFAFGSWQKQLDEALVLEFTPPECEYWNFQLCSMWQENLDSFEDGNGYVTKFRRVLERDGRVRIIVSERDPAIGANWVSSYGHDKGIWGLRLIRTETTVPVTLWRLPLSELQAQGWNALASHEAVATGEFVD
jgi:hypothetical protein